MKITSRELRDMEIREAFRGYHRDDVNDLLERAAVTIEGLDEQIHGFIHKMNGLQGDMGRNRETEDIVGRTLLLAQRAADEAVAEAETKARDLIASAEATAHRVLGEAQKEAQERGEAERVRLEREVAELGAARDVLVGDIEGLARYESEHRDQMVRRLEADLVALKERTADMPEPPKSTGVIAPVTSSPRADDEEKVSPQGSPTAPLEVIEVSMSAATVSDPSFSASSLVDVTENVAAPSESAPVDLQEAEAVIEDESDALDDDAFFASLRDAVADDSPLGPREDFLVSPVFDHDGEDLSFRNVFRRRR